MRNNCCSIISTKNILFNFNAIFNVVKMYFGCKFWARVSFHTTILKPCKFQVNRGLVLPLNELFRNSFVTLKFKVNLEMIFFNWWIFVVWKYYRLFWGQSSLRHFPTSFLGRAIVWGAFILPEAFAYLVSLWHSIFCFGTICAKSSVQFWSCRSEEILWPPPCWTTSTGQYLLDW